MNLIKKAIFIGGFAFFLALAGTGQATAQGKPDPRPDFITTLNEQNIRAFLNEVDEISTGQRMDMLDEDLADYFNNHIADKGLFKSKMRYEIPGYPTQETEMELDKVQYINSVIRSRAMMEDYHADIDIQDLKIHNSGRSATFTSVVTEKGQMPFPKDPKKPNEVQMIPITGKSTCDQKLIVSFNHFIQMAEAECETFISFDPFGGKPLVPE